MKTYTNYYSNQLNEGLFSLLGKFFNWLFTDDTSDETKEYTKYAFKTANNSFEENDVKAMQNVLKAKDTKTLKEQVEKYRKEHFADNETKGDEWEMIILSIKIRLAKDGKDNKTVKELTERFHELTKKNPEVGKKLAAEIKKQKSTDNKEKSKDNNEQTNDENSEQNNDGNSEENKDDDKTDNTELKSVLDADGHVDIIEEICKSKNFVIKDLEGDIEKYCNDNDIKDPKQYYGLLLTKLGSMMSEKSDEYIKNICGE